MSTPFLQYHYSTASTVCQYLFKNFFNKKRRLSPSLLLCGLTDLPTSCPWEGSAVGLEPTAHRMPLPYASRLHSRGWNFTIDHRQGLMRLWYPSSHRVSTLGLGSDSASPRCDYSIAQFAAFVNTFLKKFFYFSFKNPLTMRLSHAIIQVQSRTPRRGERGWTGSRGVQPLVSYN
jgi:hypothetical protein